MIFCSYWPQEQAIFLILCLFFELLCKMKAASFVSSQIKAGHFDAYLSFDSFSLLYKFVKKQKMFLNSNKMKKWNKINECLNNLWVRKQFCQRVKVASFKPWLRFYINILWRLCESYWNFFFAKRIPFHRKNYSPMSN